MRFHFHLFSCIWSEIVEVHKNSIVLLQNKLMNNESKASTCHRSPLTVLCHPPTNHQVALDQQWLIQLTRWLWATLEILPTKPEQTRTSLCTLKTRPGEDNCGQYQWSLQMDTSKEETTSKDVVDRLNGAGFSPRRSIPWQDVQWRRAGAKSDASSKRSGTHRHYNRTLNRNKTTTRQWWTQGPATLGACLGSGTGTCLVLHRSILSRKLQITWPNQCLKSRPGFISVLGLLLLPATTGSAG